MATRNTLDTDIEPIIKFTATDGVRQYPFGFRVFRENDIQVYLGDTLQISGYSVILTEGIRGGNVVFNSDLIPGTLITLLAEVPFIRDSDFNESGTFRANVVNKELDIVMALLRQLRNSFSLSAHLPPYYKGLNLELPIPEAGKSILWNTTGDGMVNSKDKIDDLLTDTKAQADIAIAQAQIATEQATIAATKAVAANVSALAAAQTVNGFDTHVAGKQTIFDSNAQAKTTTFNTNAATKQAAVDASAVSAAGSAAAAADTLSQANMVIDSAKNIALNEFNANTTVKTNAYNTNHEQKIADYNANTVSQTNTYNANHEQKITVYNANATDKQAAVDVSAAEAANSALEAKQYRDEAAQIANIPLATEGVAGAAKIATAEDMINGTADDKIVTPAKLETVLALHRNNQDNPHAVTASQLGLGNLNNTADVDKPVSNAMQVELDKKQNTITGAVSGLVTENLTASRVLISSSAGKIDTSIVTADEVSSLSGVTSSLQEQLNTKVTEDYQPRIEIISATSGTIALSVNKVYSIELSGATTFSLPSIVGLNVFNQIKIMLKVTGTPAIAWGTDQFFNKTTPEIEAGCYDIYFDYDNNLAQWVCGAMAKGAAS